MRILCPDNSTFSMNDVPDLPPDGSPTIVDDLRYCVLDYSNQNDIDFYFVPLLYLDQFPRPAADIRIGPYNIQMPLDWSIVIGDKNLGLLEIVSLQQLNDRDMDAFVINPTGSFTPEFLEITIENVFPDVHWSLPKLKHGHLLAAPLHTGPAPICAFFVKDTNKLPESLDITKVL